MIIITNMQYFKFKEIKRQRFYILTLNVFYLQKDYLKSLLRRRVIDNICIRI